MKILLFTCSFLLLLGFQVSAQIVLPEYPIPYRKDTLWGYCDTNKRMIVEPVYPRVNVFSGPITDVSNGRKTAFINVKGELVTGFDFDQAGAFSDGMAKILVGGKSGFINEQGKIVVKPKYDGVESFKNGFAVVRKGDVVGVINKKGKEVIKPQYTAASTGFENGYLLVQKGNEVFFVNAKNKRMNLPGNWEIAGDFSEGLAPIHKTDIVQEHDQTDTVTRIAFIDTKANVVLDSMPSLFELYANYHEGFAITTHYDPVIQTNCYYFIYPPGKVSPFYVSIRPFQDGLAVVKAYFEDSVKVIDTSFQTVFFLDVEDCGEFSEGMLASVKGGLYGYIHKSGMIAIPFRYENASPFKRGIAIVLKNGMPGCIDMRGREYWE